MIPRSDITQLQSLYTSPDHKHYYLLEYQSDRNFIINTKYHLNLFTVGIITKKISELLPEQLYQDFPLESDWIIIPIRLHWLSRFKRRFDLNEIMTKKLANQIDNLTYLSAIKNIKHQTQGNCTDKRSRQLNAIGKFKLKNSAISKVTNQNIILFDDVVATGSTLTQCEKLLKHAGAKNVVWLSLAHST